MLFSSSETQGQIVGARERLNGRKRAPGDNVLPDQFQTVAAVLASDWCQKIFCVLLPNQKASATTVWNWSGKTLSQGALFAVLYFLRAIGAYFPARLDFPSPPLSAPGSPRMCYFKPGEIIYQVLQ